MVTRLTRSASKSGSMLFGESSSSLECTAYRPSGSTFTTGLFRIGWGMPEEAGEVSQLKSLAVTSFSQDMAKELLSTALLNSLLDVPKMRPSQSCGILPGVHRNMGYHLWLNSSDISLLNDLVVSLGGQCVDTCRYRLTVSMPEE